MVPLVNGVGIYDPADAKKRNLDRCRDSTIRLFDFRQTIPYVIGSGVILSLIVAFSV